MTGSKPYSVWWKRQDEWKSVFSSHSPADCIAYGEQSIHHGGITQRIELRDSQGCLVALYDADWRTSP